MNDVLSYSKLCVYPTQVADSDSIERLLQCGKEAIPLFSVSAKL